MIPAHGFIALTDYGPLTQGQLFSTGYSYLGILEQFKYNV